MSIYVCVCVEVDHQSNYYFVIRFIFILLFTQYRARESLKDLYCVSALFCNRDSLNSDSHMQISLRIYFFFFKIQFYMMAGILRITDFTNIYLIMLQKLFYFIKWFSLFHNNLQLWQNNCFLPVIFTLFPLSAVFFLRIMVRKHY